MSAAGLLSLLMFPRNTIFGTAKHRIPFLAKRRICVFTNRRESDRHDGQIQHEGYCMRETLKKNSFSFYQPSCYMRNKKRKIPPILDFHAQPSVQIWLFAF